MTAHADLTGAELHEPKGAASAAVNTVYVADGAGSGTWKTLEAGSMNTGSVKNVNKLYLAGTLADVSTASALMFASPVDGTVSKVTLVLGGTLTGADATVTVKNKDGSTMGTATVAFTGSAKGDDYTVTPVSNNSLLEGDWFEVVTDGASTGAQLLAVTVEISIG